jgi:NAD(P)-dependent dehydrogenase (short-subunit alcohol dehydrogenase family)
VATIAFTGSAGGMGVATRALLESQGHRFIGVDVRDAEVIADVSNPDGRMAMVSGVIKECGGVLDGLVAGAGISSNGSNEELVMSTNFFGAVAALTGLRACLAKGTNPSAIAISSNSTTSQTDIPVAAVEACLADDEPAARAAAKPAAMCGYPASKLALAHWVREQAVTDGWVGSGIRLNAIAPGVIETPLVGGVGGVEFILSLGDIYPVPIKRAGTADEVAALLSYLLSPAAGFFVGSVLFMDGGTDAKMRTREWPAAR